MACWPTEQHGRFFQKEGSLDAVEAGVRVPEGDPKVILWGMVEFPMLPGRLRWMHV